jgi:hypothetical protein
MAVSRFCGIACERRALNRQRRLEGAMPAHGTPSSRQRSTLTSIYFDLVARFVEMTMTSHLSPGAVCNHFYTQLTSAQESADIATQQNDSNFITVNMLCIFLATQNNLNRIWHTSRIIKFNMTTTVSDRCRQNWDSGRINKTGGH